MSLRACFRPAETLRPQQNSLYLAKIQSGIQEGLISQLNGRFGTHFPTARERLAMLGAMKRRFGAAGSHGAL